ncbi:hypothetical protein ACTHGU_13140 [Chitinophagaceae bacterium MMS25-I14]
MNLRNEILKEHSKQQALKIAVWIGKNPERFNQLIGFFMHDEYRVVQRSAWIVSIVGEKHPGLIQPHLAELVARMQEEGVPVAVKRNVVRILQHQQIPEALHGPVMNTCFDLLADPKETVAVRVFSMTVLGNLAHTYPEIKQELRTIIEDQLEQGATAGFIARAKKLLPRLS